MCFWSNTKHLRNDYTKFLCFCKAKNLSLVKSRFVPWSRVTWSCYHSGLERRLRLTSHKITFATVIWCSYFKISRLLFAHLLRAALGAGRSASSTNEIPTNNNIPWFKRSRFVRETFMTINLRLFCQLLRLCLCQSKPKTGSGVEGQGQDLIRL